MHGVIAVAVNNLFELSVRLYVIRTQRPTLKRDFKSLVYCGQIESRLVCGIILEFVLLLHIADYLFNPFFESRRIFRKLTLAHGGALLFIIAYRADAVIKYAAYFFDIPDL